jgi:hypothetical protein
MKSDINIRKQSIQIGDNKWQCMDIKCNKKYPAQRPTFSRKKAAARHHVCVVLEINGTFIQLTTSRLDGLSHPEGPYHLSTL